MKRDTMERSGRGAGRGGALLGARLALAGALLAAGASGQVWEVGEQGLTSPVGPQAGGQFGQVLASGDFNDDGYDDLVVGSPVRDNGATVDCGRVQLYWGSATGLQAAGGWIGAVSDMNLGAALAAGDFDGDGDDDIAAGAPGFPTAGNADAGRVYVFDYDGGGWTTSTWDQDDFAGLTVEPDDRFGEVFVVGDFNNDGRDDLVVGIPREDLSLVDSGAILQILGSASGLTTTGALFVPQAAFLGPEQAGARLGEALAAGDFSDDDVYYDLAVGAPRYDLSGSANAGIVGVLFGGSGGLTTTGLQIFSDAFLGGSTVAGDEFGAALAAADLDRTLTCWNSFTCRTDLIIGVPGKQVGGAPNAGRVWVIYAGTGVGEFDQGDLSGSAPEADDRFGEVLVSKWLESRFLNGGDVNHFADSLVVGVPGENWAGTPFQGVVHLVFGSPTGVNGGDPSQFRIAADGLSSAPPAAFDNFGYSLAIGRFDDGAYADVAIGVVGRDTGATLNTGMVQVMYGALFADGFESGGEFNW